MQYFLSFLSYLGMILGVFGVTAIQYLRINKEPIHIEEKTHTFVNIGLFFVLITTFYQPYINTILQIKGTIIILIMLFSILEAFKLVRQRFAQSFNLTSWYFLLILAFFNKIQFSYVSLLLTYFFVLFFVYVVFGLLYYNVKDRK